VFDVADDVKVRVVAVPPVGVKVIDVVAPLAGSPVNVPTTCARVFPVDALIGNTTKSLVQFGVAFVSKLYFAGDIPGATPPAPSETAQSLPISSLSRLGTIGGLRHRRESGGPWRCSSRAYARGSFRIFSACSGVKPAGKRTCFELQSSGTGTEPSGLGRPCPNACGVKHAATTNAQGKSEIRPIRLESGLGAASRARV